MPDQEKEVIFVYNARSDLFSRISDFAHKIISSDTYSCKVCQLTHGSLSMYREWADFLHLLPCQVSFHYKDQWKGIGSEMGFPLILLKEGKETKVIIFPEELKSLRSLQELTELVEERLPAHFKQ